MTNTETGKNALIVEGGAMRSVFSAGVLDAFLAEGFNPFDFSIGVSAGAFNLIAYQAAQPGHSLQMYLEFALHKNFISYRRFLRGGHLLDLDWLVQSTLAKTRAQVEQVAAGGIPIYIGITDVATGAARYLQLNRDNYASLLKASIALPLLYRGFPRVDGRPMTDGGVANGIPVAEAIRRGARRIMVIRSRPWDYRKQDTLGHRFIRWRLRAHAELVATMRRRVQIHTDTMQLIRQPPAEVKIVEVCPPAALSLGRFSRRREPLRAGYQTGVECAQDAIRQWRTQCENLT